MSLPAIRLHVLIAVAVLSLSGCSTVGGRSVSFSSPDAECRQATEDPRGAATFDPVARAPWWWSAGPNPSRTAINSSMPDAVAPRCGAY
jgi:hypothetical protein